MLHLYLYCKCRSRRQIFTFICVLVIIQQTNLTTEIIEMDGSVLDKVTQVKSTFVRFAMSILTLKIRDGWFYLTGDLGAPFWASEAFTMQILTPEKRDEWFSFMDDPTACIFRQVVHWNSTWSSFDAINISNADFDGRDAHLEADAFVISVKSAILLSYGVILLCYNRSYDLIMFSLIFLFFQCTAKSHLKNVRYMLILCM